MFGLMTRKAHIAALDRKDGEAYKAWSKVTDERDKFRQQVRDTCTRAERAERELTEARSTITGLRAQVSAAETVIAELKPDVEAWRDRQRKAADYEKNRRVRPARAKKAAK
ncbi:hypothetical protein ACIPPQ_20360 [Sphingopyxis sp. LARHCG72]